MPAIEIPMTPLHLFILAYLDGRDAYSVEIWEAWVETGHGDPLKRRGLPPVQRSLKDLERGGLVRGREALPEEHQAGPLARRYYVLAQARGPQGAAPDDPR